MHTTISSSIISFAAPMYGFARQSDLADAPRTDDIFATVAPLGILFTDLDLEEGSLRKRHRAIRRAGGLPLPQHPTAKRAFVYVDCMGIDTVLFTSCEDRALDIIEAAGRFCDGLPAGWPENAWQIWNTQGHVHHLREAEQRGIEGIGKYDPTSGWEILPIAFDARSVSMTEATADKIAPNS